MGKFLIAVLLLAIAGEASAQQFQFECKNCIPASSPRFTVVNRMGPFRQRATVTTCTGPACTVPGPQVTAGAVQSLVPMVAGECVNGSCSAPATASPVWRPFGGRFRR